MLPLTQAPYKSLILAARYSTLLPAKRLRPLIALEMATSYGSSLEEVLNPAAALELIHTYTLIHDDLPCMDDEVLRRGKPPLHKAVHEGLALLAGDYLLTYAFEVISKERALSAEKRVELIATLSSLAGADGVIGGQVLDLYPESHSFEEMMWVNSRKTGHLFLACFEFAAIISDVDEKDRALFREFGALFGLTYQLLDDLEDEGTLKAPITDFLTQMENVHQSQSIQTDIQKALLLWMNRKYGDRS